MRILTSWRALDPSARGASLALGNFDGVHRGHQAVLAAARGHASGPGWGVVSFEPHPREVFRPADPPFRLSPGAAKHRALAATGADLLFDLPFDDALRTMPAERFVDDVLLQGMGASHLACGPDFRFGHRRGGDIALLCRLAAARGAACTVVEPLAEPDGGILSSSGIRDALRQGDCDRATRLLGRTWEIEGVVEGGARLGRTLGFPTANLRLGRSLVPRLGVYAVRVALGDAWFGGVASLGLRPTVNPLPEPLLEAHLFDFAGDLYGRTVRVALVAFLRDEARFDGLDALVEAMEQDAARARALV